MNYFKKSIEPLSQKTLRCVNYGATGAWELKKLFSLWNYFQFCQFQITSKPILKSLSLSKFQVEPVLTLIDKLMVDVTKTNVQLFSDRLKTNVELWPTLIDLGKKFIPADFSSLGI